MSADIPWEITVPFLVGLFLGAPLGFMIGSVLGRSALRRELGDALAAARVTQPKHHRHACRGSKRGSDWGKP